MLELLKETKEKEKIFLMSTGEGKKHISMFVFLKYKWGEVNYLSLRKYIVHYCQYFNF